MLRVSRQPAPLEELPELEAHVAHVRTAGAVARAELRLSMEAQVASGDRYAVPSGLHRDHSEILTQKNRVC
jgi:hypothetical protein